MSMYHRDAVRSGNCRQCGRGIAPGDRIHVAKSRYTTTTRCVVCRPEAGQPADGWTNMGRDGCGMGPTLAAAVAATEGPHPTTSPATIEAAAAIMADAPAHLRASLESIRSSVANLAWLGCPREAVAAAILLGREDGAAEYRATVAGDIAGQVASVIDTIGETVLPAVEPAPDAFDAVDCTCPDAAPYAADTSDDDARAGAFDLDAFAGILSIPDASSVAQNSPFQAPEQPTVAPGRFRRVPATVRPVRDVAPLAPTVEGAPWG